MLHVFKAPSMKRACFWRFLLNNCIRTNKTTAFINFTSFKSCDIVKFKASTLDQCHHLLINLSCKSASKPLNAISARSAVCFFAAHISVEQEVLPADITTALLVLYLHASDVHQHSTFNGSRAKTCSEVMTSDEVGLLYKTFAHIGNGSRFYLIFQWLKQVCNW